MQQRAGRQQAAMPIPLPRAKLAEVCAPLPIVRRLLAERSRDLLHRYRRGEPAAPGCPLATAVARRTAS